jgi:hypothetical protein
LAASTTASSTRSACRFRTSAEAGRPRAAVL